jgi:hypothetical protein
MRLSALALMLVLPALRADEGMWTFDNVPVKEIRAKYGVALDAAWLKKLQLATLRFPNGTGAFVSREGLVVTNHHVGRDAIAQVSRAGADLVKNGFSAASRDQEIQVPGFELMMLVSTEDVTARVNGAVKTGMTDKEALAARRNAQAEYRKAEEARTGLTCEPVTLYQGGEYWLYRYRKFKDVRLVAAPEVQVASFGGDLDNYTYPRWNLDFALFRVYEDGRPYHPEAFLPFTQTPLKAGDLTLISGHPGTTFRGQTLAQTRYAKEVGIPFQLAHMARLRKALEARSASRVSSWASASPRAWPRWPTARPVCGWQWPRRPSSRAAWAGAGIGSRRRWNARRGCSRNTPAWAPAAARCSARGSPSCASRRNSPSPALSGCPSSATAA